MQPVPALSRGRVDTAADDADGADAKATFQAAQTPDMSAQSQASTSHDPRADPESAVSQDADGLASG